MHLFKIAHCQKSRILQFQQAVLLRLAIGKENLENICSQLRAICQGLAKSESIMGAILTLSP